MQIEQFLTTLIDIPSITGQESAITAYLHDFLSRKGLQVRRMPVEGKRNNLLAYFNENPPILLSTHCDTVPPFFPARMEGGTVYGRGACDAKGMIAAMIFTQLSLPESVRSKTGLLIVVGEETDSIGAKTAVKSDIQCEFIINGEPTGNRLVRAQKGTFIFKLNAGGKSAHSGYPQLGDSAISKLLDQLSILGKLNWGSSDNLGESSFNIGTINGGKAPNIIPDKAEAQCCVRVVAEVQAAQYLLETHLNKDIDCQIISNSNPVEFWVPEGMESIVVSFGSDAAYLSSLGKVLMAGPGDIQIAHTADESIKINQLYEAVEMYQMLISKLLNH